MRDENNNHFNDKQFNWLINPLLDCAYNKFNEMTYEKYKLVELICNVVRINMVDLHNKRSVKRRKIALEYFSSDRFKYHCECIAVPQHILLYIIQNPQKYENYTKAA